MRIIGIDPGIQITGYCVLDCFQDEYQVVTSGSIQTSKNQTTPERLLEIAKDNIENIKNSNRRDFRF